MLETSRMLETSKMCRHFVPPILGTSPWGRQEQERHLNKKKRKIALWYIYPIHMTMHAVQAPMHYQMQLEGMHCTL